MTGFHRRNHTSAETLPLKRRLGPRAAKQTASPHASASRADIGNPRGFSLRLLFGAMTILCVAAAIARLVPILGVLVSVIGVPTLVRAAVLIKRRREVGVQVIFEDRVFVTIHSVG